MRMSIDELTPHGTVHNGYDYQLNVWVRDGLILDCRHPQVEVGAPGELAGGSRCCNARKLRGRRVDEIAGHDQRYGEVA